MITNTSVNYNNFNRKGFVKDIYFSDFKSTFDFFFSIILVAFSNSFYFSI